MIALLAAAAVIERRSTISLSGKDPVKQKYRWGDCFIKQGF